MSEDLPQPIDDRQGTVFAHEIKHGLNDFQILRCIQFKRPGQVALLGIQVFQPRQPAAIKRDVGDDTQFAQFLNELRRVQSSLKQIPRAAR